MTRAYNTATTQQNSGGAVPAFIAGKNAIINGDFAINQRGFTSTTTDAYGLDRWKQVQADGTSTYSVQTFTAGAAPVAGYEGRNFARVAISGQTLAGAATILIQPIESVRTFAGQTVTISFWAKANSGTPAIAIELQQSFGTGGSPSSTVNTYAGKATISTSWARYSVTGTVPSISGKTIGSNNNDALNLNIWTSSGSNTAARVGSIGIQNNTFDIWGVQVEAGSVATPFDTAAGTIGGELALCQRYCTKITAASGNGYERVGTALGYNSGSQWIILNIPVEMRVYPTSMTTSGGFSVWNANRTSLTSIALSTTPGGSRFNINLSANANQNGFNYFEFENNANGFVLFSAEL
jgi:hypothetical protein